MLIARIADFAWNLSENYLNSLQEFQYHRKRLERFSRHLNLLDIPSDDSIALSKLISDALCLPEVIPRWESKHPESIIPENGRWDKGSYREFLSSEEWNKVKIYMVYCVADGRCQVCNSSEHLHVHHRSYELLGHEHLSFQSRKNLIVLCASCHRKHHGIEDPS